MRAPRARTGESASDFYRQAVQRAPQARTGESDHPGLLRKENLDPRVKELAESDSARD